MKKVVITVIFFTGLLSMASAQKSAIYAPDGVALNGYDVIAFFTQGKPVKGSTDYSFQWNGVKWLFYNNADLETFKESPEKYAPQYG
ncbi:MAG TPA: YHS domain-containing (seleno)protein, partial [Puia sp.]|nr:YHS domain-containing (seleno)protein [Puia sp.]